MRPTIPITCFVLAAATGGAQTPFSQGPAAGVAVAFSVTGTATGVEQIQVRRTGFDRTPRPWAPRPGRPDFRYRPLFEFSSACGAPANPLDIDAFSVGLDQIPVDATTQFVAVEADRWYALLFNVGATPTASGVVAGESLQPPPKTGADGDLFAHVFDGSSLDPRWVNTVERALDAAELVPPAGGIDVDATDAHLPLYALDAHLYSKLPAFARLAPTFYFSVAPASVADVPSCWWTGTSVADRTAGAIFSTRWTGSGWVTPTVFLTPSRLGIGSSADVIGLSIDRARGFVVFSLVASVSRSDPLMFFDLASSPGTYAVVFQYSTPTEGAAKPVSCGAGVGGNDDVEGICITDPGPAQSSSGYGGLAFGSPLPPCASWPFAMTMNATVFRDGAGGPVLRTLARGIVPSSPGVLLLGVSNQLELSKRSACVVDPRFALLDAIGGACGGWFEMQIPLPVTPTLAGTSGVLQWAALNAVGQLEVANATTINLF